MRGEKITVGPPYFDFFLRVLGLPLLLLMGIGPLVAWRRSSLRALGTSLIGPAVVRARLRDRAGRARRRLEQARASSPTRSRASCSPRSCSSSSAARAREGARPLELARRVLVARRPQPAPLRRLRRARGDRPARDRHRRRRIRRDQGAAPRARPVDVDRRLRPPLPRLGRAHGPNRRASAPGWRSRAAAKPGHLPAGKNRYPAEQQVSNEVAIHTDWLARRTCS